MKILMLSTLDSNAGAARAAYRLHKVFLTIPSNVRCKSELKHRHAFHQWSAWKSGKSDGIW